LYVLFLVPCAETLLISDFKSGYDRGHMVPAADAKISQKAMDETFYLSNIAPQVGDGFNRHCKYLSSSLGD
jgi:DNA/RNA endonuclease G (NUC1)